MENQDIATAVAEYLLPLLRQELQETRGHSGTIADECLSEKQAAQYCGFSASHFRNMRSDHDRFTQRPAYIKVNNSIRYWKDDLDRWLRSITREE